MATQVSEREARRVAEAARETGVEAAELRQGAVPRQLPARPDPSAAAGSTPAAIEKGEAFLAHAARSSSRARSTRCRSSATRRSPTTSSRASRQLGALGMKVPEEYGGLGLSQVYYNRALALAGTLARRARRRCSPRTSRSAWPSRCCMFGSEEQKREWLPKVAQDHISAFLLTEPDVGSDPARLATTADADRGRLGLRAQRHASCGRPTARSPTSSS